MATVHNEIRGTVYGSVVQVGQLDRLVLATRPPETLGGLPPQSGPFVGRETEVQDLLTALRQPKRPKRSRPPAPSRAPTTNLITGPAGVGKTSLAIRVAESALARGWYAGVLFVDLQGTEPEGQVDPYAVLGTFFRAAGIDQRHLPPDKDERTTWYRSWLAARPRPILIVLDNAASRRQVEPLLPGNSRSRAIVTSRYTLPDLTARRFDLDVLDASTAADAMAAAVTAARPADRRVASDRSAAVEIAELCGGLPLALSVVAARLVDDERTSLRDLSNQLHSAPDTVTELHFDDRSVSAALALSYRALSQRTQLVFRLLSLHPGPHISDEAAAALADCSLDDVRLFLASLRRAHLVRATTPTPGSTMPDLVRQFARGCAQREEILDARRQALQRLLAHFDQLTDMADRRIRDCGGHEQFRTLHDAVEWLDRERLCVIGAAVAGHEAGLHHQVVALAHNLRGFFGLRGRWDDLAHTHTLALESARQLADRHTEAKLLLNLGEAHREQARRAQRHIFAKRLEEIALCYYHKASDVYLDLNDRDGMKDVTDRVMTILAIRNNELRGVDMSHYEQAVHAYRQTGDSKRLAIALNNLGVQLGKLGNHAEALDCHQEALALWRELGDRWYQARALLNIGNVYRAQGEPAKALASFHEAEELSHYGSDDARYNIGLVHLDAGQIWKARRCLRWVERVERWPSFDTWNIRDQRKHMRYVRRWLNPQLARRLAPRGYLVSIAAVTGSVATLEWHSKLPEVPDSYDLDHALDLTAAGDLTDHYPEFGNDGGADTGDPGVDYDGGDSDSDYGGASGGDYY